MTLENAFSCQYLFYTTRKDYNTNLIATHLNSVTFSRKLKSLILLKSFFLQQFMINEKYPNCPLCEPNCLWCIFFAEKMEISTLGNTSVAVLLMISSINQSKIGFWNKLARNLFVCEKKVSEFAGHHEDLNKSSWPFSLLFNARICIRIKLSRKAKYLDTIEL